LRKHHFQGEAFGLPCFLALLLAGIASDGRAQASTAAPMGAKPTASPEGSLRPAPEPIRFVFPEGQSRGEVEGVAGPGRPAVFLVTVPARTALTVGVASKSNEARFSIYEEGSSEPIHGTQPDWGAVRWIGQSRKGGELRVVVFTSGVETPVRLQVSIDRELDFNPQD
jgi:hypothetical protein